ncbi:hypothetical protein Cgig2_003062 [Carnegiea gigantea]|uniref:Uncharacterized protein n=1 Tax=Carnegiea gigantea TaxID=171969 RepID=A0A9Q1JMH4_9CARY|nr:hypothetical protein Cgig2_003062 [Carnegiea gigantea]
MPFMPHFASTIGVQILSRRTVIAGAWRRILCKLPKEKYLFHYYTSMISSGYHFLAFYIMKLFLSLRNSRLPLYRDVHIDMDFNTLPSPKDMLGLHRGYIVLFLGYSPPLRGKLKCSLQEWWARVFLASTCATLSKGDLKRRKRDEGPSNSKLKLRLFTPESLSDLPFKQYKPTLLI